MSTALRRPRLGRETRLLLATIVISAATLFVLAWFRFPEAPPAAPAQAREQPLERLAARAAYDELNAIVSRVEAIVVPGVVVLRTTPDPANTSTEGNPPAASPRLVTALRLPDGLAVAAVSGTAIVEQFVDRWVPAPILAHDPVRGLSVLRVAGGAEGGSLLAAAKVQAAPGTPGYAMAIEGAPRGPAVRPVFVGRLDPSRRAGWPRAWFVPATVAASGPGVVMVDLDGRLIGMTVGNHQPVLVPAAEVEMAARRLLAEGPPEPGDLGLELGTLTPRLMEATGSAGGAIVAAVRRGGPGEGPLQPGDVIERLGDERIRSAADLVEAVRALAPGTVIDLTVRRNQEEVGVTVTAASAESLSAAHGVPAEGDAAPGARLGLGLRTERGGGARVTSVAPGSAGIEAGVQAGDLITWFAGADRPSPAQVRRLFGAAAPGGHLLLAVDRGGVPQILAMGKR